MNTDRAKLAAVLFADMVGYSSRQQGLALELRQEMMALADNCLAATGGRLIKTAGDEIFAEFSSGSAAIACAIQIQATVASRNFSAPPARRFLLRIGINTGEVAVEAEDLMGGTVNVAKRAEQLAAPGGICVTETVWRHAETGLQAGFVRLGMIPIKADQPRQIFFHRYDTKTGRIGQLGHQLRARHAGLIRIAAAATGLLILGLGLRLGWPASDPDKLVFSGMQQLERYDLPHHIENGASAFKKALALDPKSPKALDGLAWAQWLQYHDTGDFYLRGEALKNATNALDSNPAVVYADIVLGLMAQEMGDYTNAVVHLHRANDHAHLQDGALMARLAKAELLAGERTQALDFARQAEEMAGRGWDAWHQLGVFWHSENDLSNSLHAFTQAGGCKPTSPLSAGQVINIMLESGHWTEALEEARQFADENNSPEALSIYGSALLAETNYLEAYRTFKRAAELCPTNYLYFGNAGLMLFEAGTNATEWTQLLKDKAVALAQAILEEEHGNAQVRTRLATYEAALGEQSSGLEETARTNWNKLALADADEVLNENPFLPNIIGDLIVPYSILDRSDRLLQCQIRLNQLSGKP